jgi:hypothetical protein
MPTIQLGLFLAIVLGLAGFTLQNLSPQLSLAFLGWRSPPLALGYLILGSIGAGIATGLLLLGILRFFGYLTWRQSQTPRPQPKAAAAPESNSDWDWDDRPPERPSQPPPPVDRPVDQANYLREDWSYEVDQRPKSGSQSGSSYSYSYRDADKSGVGQRESVYDADYRVIVPPPASSLDDDDFDFDFDDEEVR